MLLWPSAEQLFFPLRKNFFSQSNRSALKRPVWHDSALVGAQALQQGSVGEAILVDGAPSISVRCLAERTAANKAVDMRSLRTGGSILDAGGFAGKLLGNGKDAVGFATNWVMGAGRCAGGTNFFSSWGDTELGCWYKRARLKGARRVFFAIAILAAKFELDALGLVPRVRWVRIIRVWRWDIFALGWHGKRKKKKWQASCGHGRPRQCAPRQCAPRQGAPRWIDPQVA